MSVLTTDPAELRQALMEVRKLSQIATTDAEMRQLTSKIAQLTRAYRIAQGIGIPSTLMEHVKEADPKYKVRPHLAHLSAVFEQCVKKVEQGENQYVAVSMPPRMGKSYTTSVHLPAWLLRSHPDWQTTLISHDGSLARGWAKQIRELIEKKPDLGIALKKDGGATGTWNTVEGGGVRGLGVKESFTGLGTKVLVLDDLVKDFVDAHSETARQAVWDWWLSVAQLRLEPPYLVIAVGTRWHEDDFIGRLQSPDTEGDPKDWQIVKLPALAEQGDALGRAEGEPLYSPLLEENESQALVRTHNIASSVGTYVFSAMFQQRPAPQKGAIFDMSWWRYWTTDKSKATEDGRVVYLRPETLTDGTWLDSWDCAFKGAESTTSNSWVVGQRWVRHRANRYLIAQKRDRWTFTQTLAQMRSWSSASNPVTSPYGHLVHKRVVEDKANGPAILDTLKDEISGMKPATPTTSKEARARAVTPECESGNVFFPHPTDPGNEWVADLLGEIQNFPHGTHDDQVDSMTQALEELRIPQGGKITVPGRTRAGRAYEGPAVVTGVSLSQLTRRR